MSDDEKSPKSGYKNPPAEHRFRKGKSGNPRGRPPKVERSFLPRQTIRDILTVTEGETKIRTAHGVKEVAIIEAILIRMVQRALEGHGPSLRYVHQIHEKAIADNYNRHKKHYSMLDKFEDSEIITPATSEFRKGHQNYLNELRKSTRRLT